MPRIVAKAKNNKKKEEIVTGFLGGLNVFQDQTLIRDSELTEAKNIILSVDGIEPRPGTLNHKDGAGNRVAGGIGYYQSDGTRRFLRFNQTSGKIEYYNDSTPDELTGHTYDTTAAINFLLARDKVYTFNGEDNLTEIDDTSITTYTAITTPTGLAVNPQGTTGSEPYSYRVSAFNDQGETLACSSVSISNGNATLNATNYNRLTWSSVSGATGYNIWGRTATGLGHTYMASVYGTTTYDDKGQDDPSLTLLPPEGNSTGGVKGTMAVFAIGRIFAAGDPDNPSRLYYGGVADNLANFSGAGEGGGYVDVFKNDGSVIRAILPFQGGVIVWKDNAIYKFSFTSEGLAQLEEITRSFGGISFRSAKHVENDIVFAAKKDGRLAYYSLGNQENYSSAILRTNELSIKIASRLTDVNLSMLDSAAAFYFNNIYGCAVARESSNLNNRIWCLDTRFGAWVYWDDIKANFFMEYVDDDGTQKLYYGSEDTGYMVEMFKDERNDNGVAISVEWATKAFTQKAFHRFKKYYNPVLQFKDVTSSGAVNGQIYTNGAILKAGFSINVPTTGGTGFGSDFFGAVMAGSSQNGTITNYETASDTIVEIYKKLQGRSIKYAFTSEQKNAKYKFLSLAHVFKILSGKRLPSQNRVYPG